MNEIEEIVNSFHKDLDDIIEDMNKALGNLDYLQCCAQNLIEMLTELRGEILERADKLACAIDLNKRIEVLKKEQKNGVQCE